MSSATTRPSLGATYKKALDLCLLQWPLFPVQLVYGFLNWAALVGCLLIVGWPFLEKFPTNLSDMEKMDPDWFSKLLSSFNPAWMLSALGLLALYSVWWTLLSVLAGGGIYGRFWAGAKDGTAFSWKDFGRDCGKYFSAMFLLLGFYMAVGIGLMLAALLGEFLVILLFTLLHLSPLLALILLFPALLVIFGVTALFLVYINMSRAALMEDRGVAFALQEGWKNCWADKGRVFFGTFLMLGIWFFAALFVEGTLFILKFVPVLGFFFAMAYFAVGFFLYASYGCYFPALAVAFRQDKEA